MGEEKNDKGERFVEENKGNSGLLSARGDPTPGLGLPEPPGTRRGAQSRILGTANPKDVTQTRPCEGFAPSSGTDGHWGTVGCAGGARRAL